MQPIRVKIKETQIRLVTNWSLHYILLHVGLFYYVLGNISPKYRSSLESIQLLAVANSQVISEHGIDHILNPIIEDIKVLETVITNEISDLHYFVIGWLKRIG